ncbi:MAG: lysophospholipid acyltransferase family protein [Clostridia bacterium]
MKYMPWFQTGSKIVFWIVYSIFYKIKVTGKENIPEGGCLICSNHPGANDPFFIMVAVGHKNIFSCMGKKELYENKLLGAILIAMGTFPVDRGNIDVKAIKNSIVAINEGKKFVIFPEGTRSRNFDGKVKGGSAFIAIKTGCPILPVYIDNSPKLFGKVNITFGECIKPPQKSEKVSNEEYSQFILDKIFELGAK